MECQGEDGGEERQNQGVDGLNHEGDQEKREAMSSWRNAGSPPQNYQTILIIRKMGTLSNSPLTAPEGRGDETFSF